MSASRRAARIVVALLLGLSVALALGGGIAARGIDEPVVDPQGDCNPCPLSRVVVDQPAWDETVTVTDSPARTVHHHDLVTAEHTVAHTVLTTPAHDESYQLWVASGYWTQHWIDTSHYETQTVWVTSGYSQPYWQDTSHGEVQSVYVSQGYWYTYWVETGGYWSCSGWGEDRECDYYGSGYWTNMWIDNSYSYNRYVWIASGYWASYWVNTSHYEYPQVWVSSGYYQQQWISTGGYWATGYTPYVCSGSGIDRECDGGDYYSYWVATGYYTTNFWVDTSHYETRTRHVDDVYTTTYEVVPAVYRDWDEQIAAVTHTEVVHHPAVTHLEPITLDQLTTQSRLSGVAASSGTTGGSDGRATAPTTIAVVSNITVVDTPAGTTTRTVVDQAAYDEPRTVVDRAAYDDSYNRPVWDYDCADTCVRYIDYWETVTVHHDALTHVENVHHDAVTHSETVAVPAVTHQETLSYNATVADGAPSGSGGGDPLVDFVLLGGLMALAGAGKYASRADELKAAVAQMASLGEPIPAVLEPILVDSSPQTVTSVETAVVDALTPDETDPSTPSAQQSDTPPSGSDTAAACALFSAWANSIESTAPPQPEPTPTANGPLDWLRDLARGTAYAAADFVKMTPGAANWNGISSTISGSFMGGHGSVTFSIVGTPDGQVGALFTPAFGGTTAAVGLGFGVGPVFSNAQTVSDFNGWFAAMGGSVPVGSVDVAQGHATDGRNIVVVTPEVGVNPEVSFAGIVPLPAEFHGEASYTWSEVAVDTAPAGSSTTDVSTSNPPGWDMLDPTADLPTYTDLVTELAGYSDIPADTSDIEIAA